ncbi:MAG: hypothetical protein JSV25_14745 [Spirochaetota bacterium]|nr:MAG: hypothetical protein JSV25_14745 [Spirochaetota bacterium]
MKTRYFLFGLLAALILLWACSITTDFPEEDPEVQKAVQEAEKKTMEVINLLVEEKATGDSKGVDQFLAQEDPDGEIAALLEDYGGGVAIPIPRDVGVLGELWPPELKDFQDGDVVLFIGNGTSWQNMIMTLVYICDYHHAGVFDEEVAELMDDGFFISATIDVGVNGLCFQTLSELVYTSAVITRLRYYDNPEAVSDGVDYYNLYTQSVPTLYAFLHLNLEPVSRWNDFLWYCSKVPWRVYMEFGEMDIENNYFYFIDGKWEENRDTLFYQLYLKMLKCLLPRWAERWAGYLADRKLCRILDELITPDEIRWSGKEINVEHWDNL